MEPDKQPYEYWNTRLTIICCTVIIMIGLDVYAGQEQVTTLPIAINSIIAILGAVMGISAATRGAGPGSPPK